jgi:hypothetical protein
MSSTTEMICFVVVVLAFLFFDSGGMKLLTKLVEGLTQNKKGPPGPPPAAPSA